MTLFLLSQGAVAPIYYVALCAQRRDRRVSPIRLSEVLVTFGLTLENILLPFLFIMVPFLAFTIPIAYMFAVLLAFSRFQQTVNTLRCSLPGIPLKSSSSRFVDWNSPLRGCSLLCAKFRALGTSGNGAVLSPKNPD